MLTSNTYGYRKLPDKSFEIIEEEAQVKRQMYELCAAGYGSRTIARLLREKGIRKRNGTCFSDSDIRRMIRNPINKGTVVMNRRHFDFDTKQMVKNPNEVTNMSTKTGFLPLFPGSCGRAQIGKSINGQEKKQ